MRGGYSNKSSPLGGGWGAGVYTNRKRSSVHKTCTVHKVFEREWAGLYREDLYRKRGGSHCRIFSDRYLGKNTVCRHSNLSQQLFCGTAVHLLQYSSLPTAVQQLTYFRAAAYLLQSSSLPSAIHQLPHRSVFPTAAPH